ncbi:CpaF family protein [Pigmentibacter sp. JX0631]|uniref:CpaF family protein n=1 Tax=Pigmentibacter sp. JX0631 TaxID=2976982 RepID=UPI00246874D3|nr:CpaF family protein [Pigmentibacter sp. JX0631]WGL60198.1 CpaF family protein [Pigmentibacter sp. JX0631]
MSWEIETFFNNKKAKTVDAHLTIGSSKECDIVISSHKNKFIQLILEEGFIYIVENKTKKVFFKNTFLNISKQMITINYLDNCKYLEPNENEISNFFIDKNFETIFNKIQNKFIDKEQFFHDNLHISEDNFYEVATNILGELFFQNEDIFFQENRIFFRKYLWCLKAQFFDYGVISSLLQQEDITEVMINNYKTIFIEKLGTLILTKLKFPSEKSLIHIIEKMCNYCGRKIDITSPFCDARLNNGDRIHAIIPPLAIDGACLTIRKFPKKSFSIDTLLRNSNFHEELKNYLRNDILLKKNILISGGTGSGKTTLLNCLTSLISENERIITIEDSAELKLVHPHVIRLETRKENIENKGSISIRDLLRNALRMRPDRIIIGECRGEEALDMLQAMNTGHLGSMTTIHSNSPHDALLRLETLVLFSGYELPMKGIREQISSAIDVIIQLVRKNTGERKIQSIYELVQLSKENDYILKKIYENDAFI